MKTHARFSRQAARRVAREFVGTSRARLWPHLSDPNDLVDALVMRVVKDAWIADSVEEYTAEEIMSFRDILIEELRKKCYVLPA